VSDWLVPLADVRFSEEEVQAVAAVYRSGWLSQGPMVAEFERAFADFAGVDSQAVVAVASGTAALELSCVLAGLNAGDEVVLPSLTFAATAAAVVRCGARPVFADIAAVDRPWLSAQSARAALSERTRAIVTVSYAGHPGDVDALRELADERGLTLIEDAAHAAGAWSGKRHAGTIGHFGSFSFFANKNLPLGEGGMLVAADPAAAARARRLRSHGLTAGTWERHRGLELDYDVLEPGFNFRLDEPRAALGTRLLGRLAGDTARRGELAARYTEGLRSLGHGLVPAVGDLSGIRCAWHIFPVLLAPGADRRRLREALHGAGVQTSIHYPPLHLTTAFADPDQAALPVTEDYARRTVTLPLFGHMSDDQQALVIASIAAAVDGLDVSGQAQ
jgi:dTDP-4-amino-4,6-dideoxygalactose transaminase